MEMDVKSFSDKILLQRKQDVLRLHLYTKLLEKGIRPLENDIDILIELYLAGGYSGSDQQAAFIKHCLDKKLRKSEQSVRNTLSKYTLLKVLNKPRNTVLKLNAEYLPMVEFEKLVLNHIVSHVD